MNKGSVYGSCRATTATAMSSAFPPNPNSPDAPRVQAMARALSTLLDRVRDSRQALPHLAALESGLKQSGLLTIENASHTVLAKVCNQLASLPNGHTDESLRSLLAALQSAIHRKRPPPAGSHVETLGGSGVVEVSEISHTDFLNITGDEPPPGVAAKDRPLSCGEKTVPFVPPERNLLLF
jgi:hypothetical protein